MKSDLCEFVNPSSLRTQQYVLVAPAGWRPAGYFRRLVEDPERHLGIIADLQRFRGAVYLADGALQPSDLAFDGRHLQSIDYDSWHLVSIENGDQVVSCARYHAPDHPRIQTTAAARSALAHSAEWRHATREAITEAMEEATGRGMRFAELGGWCVSTTLRNSSQVLKTVLSMFALGQILGGTIGISTATTRHASSAILKRLGGERLRWDGMELPSYVDPAYGCEMELLRFDSTRPQMRYAEQISSLQAFLCEQVPVICHDSADRMTGSLLALNRMVPPNEPTKVPAHHCYPSRT